MLLGYQVVVEFNNFCALLNYRYVKFSQFIYRL